MQYYKYRTDKKAVTVYPFVCMHVGVEQSDDRFIREHVKRVKSDPNGVAVYMGDAGECTLRGSKGDIYKQKLNPGEQLEYAAELLDPIKDKLLWGIRGNHGNRVYKETGLDWDHQLCLLLGIPYLGQAVLMKTIVGDRGREYHLYFHHGAGGSTTPAGKVTAALKHANNVIADATFTAHSHVCQELQPTTKAFLGRADKILWKMVNSYICGCGYDSRTGYAEEKGYNPITAAYLGVTYFGQTNKSKLSSENRLPECKIWRSSL